MSGEHDRALLFEAPNEFEFAVQAGQKSGDVPRRPEGNGNGDGKVEEYRGSCGYQLPLPSALSDSEKLWPFQHGGKVFFLVAHLIPKLWERSKLAIYIKATRYR